MHILELREDPQVKCKMVELRDAPLVVSQDVGSKAGVISPCKCSYCQLCTEGACLGKACCGDMYKHQS